MTNDDIAARLNEIAALMEFDGEPFFKTKAYERAARSLEDSELPARALIEADTLTELPGVGKAIAQKIVDIEATGTCKYLEELRAKFPPTILELLRVPGVGTKTAITMFQTLGIAGIDDLRRSIEDGSIATLPRLGAKGVENLQDGALALGAAHAPHATRRCVGAGARDHCRAGSREHRQERRRGRQPAAHGADRRRSRFHLHELDAGKGARLLLRHG